MSHAPELLPCPFCGGAPQYAGYCDHTYIRCTGCGCSTEDFGKPRAVASWQMRPFVSCAEQVKQAYERGLEDAANEWQNVRVEGAAAVATVVAYSDRIRALKSNDTNGEHQ